MSPARTRMACMAIVSLWALAWTAQLPVPPAESSRVTVRAAPRPAPAQPAPADPPREAPTPPDAPSPPETPSPPEGPPIPAAATRVSGGDYTRGEALLRGEGAFPALQASYEGLGSFDAYASAMRDLGARFVVVQRRRILGEVDREGNLLAGSAPRGDYSPRARDYSDEPALALAQRRVRERWGASSALMMLVPRRLDAALFGTVAGWLAERGETAADYRQLEARYARAARGDLQLHVESGTRLDGSQRAIDLVLDLGRIAAGGG